MSSTSPFSDKKRAKQFLDAAECGDLPLLKKMVGELDEQQDLGETLASVKDFCQRNVLHLACFKGRTNVCTYLIQELKLDVNVKDENDETPLHHALTWGHNDLAVFLLENGADPNACTDLLGTSLHIVAQKGPKALLQLLLSKGADVNVMCGGSYRTPLHVAAVDGNKDSVRILLENNANPNGSQHILSPLMLSIPSQSIECVELLLKAGADPNVNVSGQTPMFAAAAAGNTAIIRSLLKAGADPNIASDSGLTPIEMAALSGNKAAVRVLFPVTSRIQSISNWSPRGVILHAHSADASAERLQKFKETAVTSKSKGDEAFKRNEYGDAIHWYTQAIEYDEYVNCGRQNAVLYSNRSFSYARQKHPSQALEDAQVCVMLRPNWPKAHYRKGVAWRMLKVFIEAYYAFRTAWRLEPENKELKRACQECFEELECTCGKGFADCNCL